MENLNGKTFGSWYVLDAHERRGHNIVWLCRCVCGKEKYVPGYELKNGHSKSCGCQRRSRLKHGMTDTKLYNVWYAMRERCRTKSTTAWYRYGGRGISVCDEWDDFKVFYKWAIENGYQEGLTLDRIDNDGNYEPSNCRWISMKKQCQNRRNSIIIEHDGQTRSLSEWADYYGVPYSRAIQRYRANMSFDRIFTKGILHDKETNRVYKHARTYSS